MTRLLLVAAVALVALLAAAGVSAGAEWDVYHGGSIQDAIDGAGEGDTIYVHVGAYVENVDVWKRVTLIGDGAEVVTVRAKDRGDHVFEVTADYVNISGFTVNGATRGWVTAGIYFGTDHCIISDNIASNNHKGISLWDSSNNNLTNNNVSNNHYGIYLYGSSSNTLTGNTISGNTYNFDVSGSSLSEYTQNIDTSNTVDGKPIYYWVDQKDRQIPSDAGFVGVVNGTNITVRDLTLTNNSHGILFAYTENSRIENVTASNNDKGICLDSSSGNTLTGNNASSNSGNGICIGSSSNNTLIGNNAGSNRCGIYLYLSLPSSSSNNTLTGNTAPNNYYGIRLSSSSNNTLTGNTASNSYSGIRLSYSSNYNTLTGNTASNSDYGIRLYASSENVLTSNMLIGNEYNFGVAGYSPFGYTQNIDTSNTVDGKPIYYWVNQTDRQIPSDAGFVGVVNGTNITVIDLTMTNNGEGVLFVYTENSRIENVTVSDNKLGIYLRSSSNNTLTDNTASNNHHGIYLEESSDNTLTDNTASDDELNICLWSWQHHLL